MRFEHLIIYDLLERKLNILVSYILHICISLVRRLRIPIYFYIERCFKTSLVILKRKMRQKIRTFENINIYKLKKKKILPILFDNNAHFNDIQT